MTAEDKQWTEEERRKGMRVFLARMADKAFADFREVDPRTLRSLQDLEILKQDSDPFDDGFDVSLISNPDNPRRIKLPSGPLIVYSGEQDKSKLIAVELSTFMFALNQELRIAVKNEFDRLIESGLLWVTPRTADVFLRYSKNLGISKPEIWRQSAISIYDAMDDDFLIALQGIRQSISIRPIIKDSLEKYHKKVFHPSVSSLESIQLSVKDPEHDHKSIKRTIDDISKNSESLSQACDIYFKKYGFLPLAPGLGLSEIVRRWKEAAPDCDVWKMVWDWADSAFGPLPKYHACSVFLVHPDFLKKKDESKLWERIYQVLLASSLTGIEEDDYNAWAIRAELTRHYLNHHEANLPGMRSSITSVFACWLSEEVVKLFPSDKESLGFFRKEWVARDLERSTLEWQLASTKLQESKLRSILLSGSSIWSISLIALLGDSVEHLGANSVPSNLKDRMVRLIIGHLSSNFPLLTERVSNSPTFAFECPLEAILDHWRKNEQGEVKEALDHLREVNRNALTSEGMSEFLKEIHALQGNEKLFISQIFRNSALKGYQNLENIWEVFSDRDWREQVLSNLEPGVFGALLSGIIELQKRKVGPWLYIFPHFIAEMAEKEENEGKRERLFGYVLQLSLSSNTTSALERLLSGNNKALFAAVAEKAYNSIKHQHTLLQSWVSSKMRRYLSVLHI